ncbi:hypothetical protein BY996DRAFT_367858 [Phakopsora pachyrhizi]|nr:hypothetical protein BY996DRAFT_367858 [Phakopsora pachyrhizi]
MVAVRRATREEHNRQRLMKSPERYHFGLKGCFLPKIKIMRLLIRWTIYSTILCGMGHLYWPFFRKQTLALKGFLVSSAAMSGMVIWADYYLLRHERYLRKADDMMRREARRGERGIIATETELNKWKQQKIEILKDHK